MSGLRAHPGTLLGHEPVEPIVPSRVHESGQEDAPLLNPRYTF